MSWEQNIGRFLDAHPGVIVKPRIKTFGYAAYQKRQDGSCGGLIAEAATLDELGELVEDHA